MSPVTLADRIHRCEVEDIHTHTSYKCNSMHKYYFGPIFINYAKCTKTNISNGSCVIIQTLAHTSSLFLLLLLVYFLVFFFFCHPLFLDVHPNVSGYSLFLLVPYGHAGIVHLCLKKTKCQNAHAKTSKQDFTKQRFT